MIYDLIPCKLIPKIRRLGYRGIPTFYKVSKFFRKKWGYVSWVEQSKNKYIYKVYCRGVYHRPKEAVNYPHCKNYEEAEVRLINELIKIVNEKEKC
jgi:hypothetical protein